MDNAARGRITSLHGFWHEHSAVLIVQPIQIVVIVLVALIIRIVAHRSIDRISRPSPDGRIPKILSPLTEKTSLSGLWDSSPLVAERRRQRAETIGSVLKSAVSFAVFLFAALLVLDRLGVDLAPFIAGTSLIGIAIGFGAQNIVKDFLGGMFMIVEDQYGVGDVIDVGQAVGTVEAVGLRTTRLRDTAGTVWYVRNGEVVRIGNQSQGFAQVVLDVPISAGDDLGRAEEAIVGASRGMHADPQWHEVFLAEPELQGVESLSREETLIRVTARVRPLEQWRAARELRGRIRVAFDAAGIPPRPGETAASEPDE